MGGHIKTLCQVYNQWDLSERELQVGQGCRLAAVSYDQNSQHEAMRGSYTLERAV